MDGQMKQPQLEFGIRNTDAPYDPVRDQVVMPMLVR